MVDQMEICPKIHNQQAIQPSLHEISENERMRAKNRAIDLSHQLHAKRGIVMS